MARACPCSSERFLRPRIAKALGARSGFKRGWHWCKLAEVDSGLPGIHVPAIGTGPSVPKGSWFGGDSRGGVFGSIMPQTAEHGTGKPVAPNTRYRRGRSFYWVARACPCSCRTILAAENCQSVGCKVRFQTGVALVQIGGGG